VPTLPAFARALCVPLYRAFVERYFRYLVSYNRRARRATAVSYGVRERRAMKKFLLMYRRWAPHIVEVPLCDSHFALPVQCRPPPDWVRLDRVPKLVDLEEPVTSEGGDPLMLSGAQLRTARVLQSMRW